MLNDARPVGEAQLGPAETATDRGASASARREHSRFQVDLDVTVTSEHNFYAGFVENMSVGGIFIATHQLAPVGERMEFSVQLPDDRAAIRGSGEVRWVRVYSEQSDAPPGMGIRFDALDPPARARIEEFLSRREPLFYDES